MRQGKREEAIAACLKAESFGFASQNLFNTLGTIHHQLGQIDKAIEYFRKAIAIKPDYPLAQWNLGVLQLLKGDFREGWIGYDARWKANNISLPARYSLERIWDGGDLKGRRILIDCEQGFGDCIQFIRFIPLIAQRGGKPILTAYPELRRLIRTVPCLEEIICPPEEIPPFDLQCPLAGLPRLFETTLQNIPTNVPYIFADPVPGRAAGEPASQWTAASKSDSSGRAKPQSRDHATHSPGLTQLAPLGAVSNVWFCSLQKGPAAADTVAPPEGLQIIDWTAELQDFADTASLIANLDLIICCDTAVAHLAGAMGKPVWLLLPFVPDWRWLLDREDSPWYPSMRLFRQPKAGDWQSPVRQVSRELRKLAKT